MKRDDWRKGLVVCAHVAKDKRSAGRIRPFRSCCWDCARDGFLSAADLVIVEIDRLLVGSLPKKEV